MNLRRTTSITGTTVVAGIAAYASYEHMRALALRAGQTMDLAAVLPLSVDGLVVVASVALVDGRTRRWSAWLAFWTGVTASILANVLAANPTWLARCVSAWPSVALLLTIEVIARGGRTAASIAAPPAETAGPPEPVSAAPAAGGDGTVTAPVRRRVPTKAADVAKAAKALPGASPARIAARAGVSEATVRRHLPAVAGYARDAAAMAGDWPVGAVNGHRVEG